MPFRQSGSTTSFRLRNQKPEAKLRLLNAPIKRIYKKKRYLKKPKQNALAINTLAKQVRSLQLNSYGQRQYRTDYCSLASGIPTQFCQTETPICFALNNFYDNNPVYRGEISAAGEPSYTTLTSTNSWAKQPIETNPGDLLPKYQWTAINNQQEVSPTTYLPIANKLKFRFVSNIHQTLPSPARYRITVFKVLKPIGNEAPQSNSVDMDLPVFFGAYRGFAHEEPRHRNHFSVKRHKVLYDKWVSFSPPSSVNGVSSLDQTITYNHYFDGKKAITQNKQTEPAGASFLGNIPSEEIIWCMISTNINVFTVSSMRIHMSSSKTWRDKKGETTL